MEKFGWEFLWKLSIHVKGGFDLLLTFSQVTQRKLYWILCPKPTLKFFLGYNLMRFILALNWLTHSSLNKTRFVKYVNTAAVRNIGAKMEFSLTHKSDFLNFKHPNWRGKEINQFTLFLDPRSDRGCWGGQHVRMMETFWFYFQIVYTEFASSQNSY